MESRAHFLQIKQLSDIASSTRTPEASIAQFVGNPEPPAHGESINAAPAIVDRSISSTTYHQYYFQDLPISVNITPSTVSCTLLAGNVDCSFDLEDVEHGHLEICYATDDKSRPEVLRMDIRQLSLASSTTLRCENGSNTLSFNLHDAKQHELRITLTWTDGMGSGGI
jgi:hypothetical protein